MYKWKCTRGRDGAWKGEGAGPRNKYMISWFTWYCTHTELHPLKIGFLVAGGGVYSYYIPQVNKSDKERKIVRKKLSFMHTKKFYTFSKRWVQFRVGAIPCLSISWIDKYVGQIICIYFKFFFYTEIYYFHCFV